MPGSSPCRIQGYPQDHGVGDKRNRKRERERMTGGDQASVSEAHNFIFKRNFLYLDLYIEGNERCKVMQNQPKHYICFVFIETRIFSAYLSRKQCCVHYLLALEACGHFMILFDKACSTIKLIFP